MDFGLGLVLSFTDNATAGINNAVNSLNQLTQTAESASTSLNEMASLSALSVVSGQIGDSFTSMGQTILSTLSQIVSKVNDTGQTLMFADNQLSKLYESSGKTGQDVLAQIQEYAKTSIFAFEDLIPVVTSLKSVGIEAFDSIASSTGASNQTLMDYAADLASFAPTMRNAYGTGIKAAMGALREYIAEGNALSLKRGAGIDITGILGEDKGATIEERSRQVADLIEQLGMVGMTAQLANTPMTKLSNMGDTLFQFLGMVSQSGVYDKFNELITKFADYVMAIPDEELESIAKTVSSALVSILEPLEWVVDKVLDLADGLRKLVATNPALVKIATIGVAITGVLLILAGVALKVTSALSGLSLMLLASGKSFGAIGGIVKAGAIKILGTLLPLTATIGLLALAWKSDFAGIRTNVTYFMNSIVSSFNTARNAVSGNVSDLVATLEDLKNRDDFFSNITIGIMKVMMAFQALVDGWNDYTLSEDNFLKAKELGILPLIEAILDLKYRFGLFKDGFIEGWKEIGENVKNAIIGFTENVKGTALEGLVDSLTTIFEKLASGDSQAWYDFGKSFAEFMAKAMLFVGALKGIDTALGFFAKLAGIVTVVSNIGGLFGKVFGGVGKIISKVFPFISGFFKNIIDVVKLVAGGAGTITEAIGVIFPKLAKVGGVIKTVATTIGSVIAGIASFLSIPAWLVGVIAVAVAGIIALVIKYKDEIFAVLSTVANWIYNNVILPIVNFFMTYIYPFIEKTVEIVLKIVEIVGAILTGLVSLVYNGVIKPLVGFFSWLWEGIKEVFAGIGDWFSEKFTSAVEGIKNVFAPLGEFFKGVWNGIVKIFGDIGTFLADAISGAVKYAINNLLGRAAGMINGFISALNFAIGVLNNLPGIKISKLTKLEIPKLAEGGIVDKPTMSIVGEAGAEAVMPLENNTGWIGNLARMISSQIGDNNIIPTNSTSQINNSNQSETNQKYLTTNNNNNQTVQGDTDNSIVFNEGAIQVTVQNATEEEAIRFAKKILEYIKRQRELDKMLSYA